MPTELFEESLEVEIEVLEAIPLQPNLETPASSYPFPQLRLTSNRKTIRIPILVMRNERVEVTFAPSLGGRVLQILDKRTGTEIFEQKNLIEDTATGLQLKQGICWGPPARQLGPVEYRIVEEQGDAPAGILFHLQSEYSTLYAGFSLDAAGTAVSAEVKQFNRDLNQKESHLGLCIFSARDNESVNTPHSVAFYSERRKSGMSIFVDESHLICAAEDEGVIKVSPVNGHLILAPRQLRTWSFSLSPISGIGRAAASSRHATLGFTPGSIQIQSSVTSIGAKVVLQMDEGTFEATADLYPEQIQTLPTGLPSAPLGVVILDKDRAELLRYQARSAPRLAPSLEPLANTGSPPVFEQGLEQLYAGDNPQQNLVLSSDTLAVKSAANSALGVYFLRAKDFKTAEDCFDNALLFNGEDHITWWMKALSRRLRGEQEGEDEGLLNAHFLAPMEPLLRAESFLRQESSSEPNPIIASISDDPDALVEIACWLYVCGDTKDLARWSLEVAKHREIPMIRYILAASLLDQNNLKMEAATEVQRAAAAPINPPYPWRGTEKRVLTLLSETFPLDLRIKDLLELIKWGRPIRSAAEF